MSNDAWESIAPDLIRIDPSSLIPVGILSLSEHDWTGTPELYCTFIPSRLPAHNRTYPATMEGERALLIDAWHALAFGMKPKVNFEVPSGIIGITVTHEALECDCGKGLLCPLNPQNNDWK